MGFYRHLTRADFDFVPINGRLEPAPKAEKLLTMVFSVVPQSDWQPLCIQPCQERIS